MNLYFTLLFFSFLYGEKNLANFTRETCDIMFLRHNSPPGKKSSPCGCEFNLLGAFARAFFLARFFA